MWETVPWQARTHISLSHHPSLCVISDSFYSPSICLSFSFSLSLPEPFFISLSLSVSVSKSVVFSFSHYLSLSLYIYIYFSLSRMCYCLNMCLWTRPVDVINITLLHWICQYFTSSLVCRGLLFSLLNSFRCGKCFHVMTSLWQAFEEHISRGKTILIWRVTIYI